MELSPLLDLPNTGGERSKRKFQDRFPDFIDQMVMFICSSNFTVLLTCGEKENTGLSCNSSVIELFQ